MSDINFNVRETVSMRQSCREKEAVKRAALASTQKRLRSIILYGLARIGVHNVTLQGKNTHLAGCRYLPNYQNQDAHAHDFQGELQNSDDVRGLVKVPFDAVRITRQSSSSTPLKTYIDTRRKFLTNRLATSSLTTSGSQRIMISGETGACFGSAAVFNDNPQRPCQLQADRSKCD